MVDLLGTALLDYYHGNYTEDIITQTNISEEDELPLPYFFRSFSEMPSIEQKALELSKGKVLDVGCGAGSHGLYLQKNGMQVTSIDISEGAVSVCKLRGLKNVNQIALLELNGETFDTILMLMNGTGIFQKLKHIATYLEHLKSLLATNGQILIDSSDLKYMYPSTPLRAGSSTPLNTNDDEGGIWVPSDRYYGALEFTMRYKDEVSEPFDWLYLDEQLFEHACLASNLSFEVVCCGENFDYLARITAL